VARASLSGPFLERNLSDGSTAPARAARYLGESMMTTRTRSLLLASATLLSLGLVGGLNAQSNLGFFVTSIGIGKGADLGGLAGADAHCANLAQTVGAGNRTWRAYLSTQAVGSASPINARDRIGTGPWQNSKGTVIAQNVNDLHSPDNQNLTKQTLLNEKGEMINGRGDNPNMHDVLTGSTMEGRAYPSGEDRTCGNWTKSGAGAAMLGHSDRQGLSDTIEARSWNSSHPSRGPDGGCSQADLRSTGGAGLFYCFAAN
jgi:hypothetical protein